MTVRQVRLSGKAARYVQMLQDFGHLDEGLLAQLLTLVRPAEGDPTGRVDLAEVRRAAAALLFDTSQGQPEGLLAEDWALLFS